jgi:transcriptional regulator with XRE-family HTH domain
MKESKMATFSERVRYLRREKGKTMREVADGVKALTGEEMSYTRLSRYENGDNGANIRIVTALALYFHVSVDYITGLSDDRREKEHYNRMEAWRYEKER